MSYTPEQSAKSDAKTTRLISEKCREEIRAAIADNAGNEVFFIAKLDADQRVVEVEPHAFGNQNAVPVLLQLAKPGDVVIHNHPDGPLEPSDADVSIASSLGSMSIGSYIIDNECARVYVVVKPVAEKRIEPLGLNECLSLISPEGALARNFPEFEYRPQQYDMTSCIADAFNTNAIAIIEAGTGTGKSLAYLIPSVLWSLKNQERVVISTNTINLQEQLIHKDIPLLQKCAGLKFTSVLMKGRNNYMCLRKAHYLKIEPLALEDESLRAELNELLAWAEKTQDGSLGDLNVQPSEHLWEQLQSEYDNCLRIRCPHYEKCFFYAARRRAARADIVVANHHLLMADLALRQETDNYTTAAILPPFDRIVFDEAHNLEDVATSYFSNRVTRQGLLRFLGRLLSTHKEDKGLLPFFARKLAALAKKEPNPAITQLLATIHNEIVPERHTLLETINAAFDHVIEELQEYLESIGQTAEQEVKLRVTESIACSTFWNTAVNEAIRSMAAGISGFTAKLKALLKATGQLGDSAREELTSPLLDMRAQALRLETAGAKLHFFYSRNEAFCHWFELARPRDQKPPILRFYSAPIDTGQNMQRAVYEAHKTIIMTSATLTVDNSFDYLRNRLGLHAYQPRERATAAAQKSSSSQSRKRRKQAHAEPSQPTGRLILLQLDTPFDYEQQAFVGVPVDIPEPNTPHYADRLKQLIVKSLVISGGRAFVLFTSYKLLNEMYDALSPIVQTLGYTGLRQGSENRHRLLSKFKQRSPSVLFATSSFWEGVDVKGEALQCLLLTKLPFQVPSEPIQEARAEFIEKQGKDPFYELEVPHAVIKFKQGFGRLIRSRTDRGAVLIFDRRVITRPYGTIFLRSLPARKVYQCDEDKLFREMKTFFGQS
jgi:ATP-dependent DNA helicase DinG